MAVAHSISRSSLERNTLAVLMGRRRSEFGRVRYHRRSGYYIDVRPHGRIWGLDGVGFGENEALAVGLLNMMRARLLERVPEEQVVAPYLHARSSANRIASRYAEWLSIKDAEVRAQDRSPRTVAEYRRYAREGGELSWWNDLSVHDLSTADLEEWSLWMSDRGLSPKTRRHVLGALRACFGWLRRKRILKEIPEWPRVQVSEYRAVILDPRTQARILAEIPEAERGAHLVAALMALRPGEVRALDAADYTPPRGRQMARLSVTKACKGLGPNPPIGPTKNRRNRDLPVPEIVSDWIGRNVPKEARLEGRPLFLNPRTGQRWSHWALRQAWVKACREAGTGHVPLYEGTKHSGATAMLGRTKDLEAVRAYLGHEDQRSTRRYAQIQSKALVRIARSGDRRSKRDSVGILSAGDSEDE